MFGLLKCLHYKDRLSIHIVDLLCSLLQPLAQVLKFLPLILGFIPHIRNQHIKHSFPNIVAVSSFK